MFKSTKEATNETPNEREKERTGDTKKKGTKDQVND